ncbi:hypothetical protein BDV11DRAFT_179915 [Aspergillus similis]
MSCLSSLISCCLPTKSIESAKETSQYPNVSTRANVSTRDVNNPQPPQDGSGNDGYTSASLPAYTPHPGMNMITQEKTLAAHMRDPSISNETYRHHHHHQHHQHSTATDEKQRLAWEEAAAANSNSTSISDSPYPYYPYHTHPRPEEVSSDVSSAISFPSSYGNTSTATRETPPPPYSPRAFSPAPSRRSMSTSSSYRHQQNQLQMQLPMSAITQPAPVFQAGRPSRWSASIDAGAFSGIAPVLHSEYERSASTTPPLPPPPRPMRFSWESDRG